MTTLLEKTRKINRLLQKSEKVDYKEISKLMSDIMGSNVYIISRKGEILGCSLLEEFTCDLIVQKVINQGAFTERYVEWLMRITETSPNVILKDTKCTFDDKEECLLTNKFTTVVPVYGSGERIGTLLLTKFNTEFIDSDLLLAEYGATVVGMEVLRERTEKIEEEARKKATVQIALATLSYSELEAIVHILGELNGSEGLLVASKIADRVGITRSVIVNALRKFESAGVIESKSLGMKGTYIRILNELLLDELKKVR